MRSHLHTRWLSIGIDPCIAEVNGPVMNRLDGTRFVTAEKAYGKLGPDDLRHIP